MPQDPLLTQLAERCRTFSAGTGISLHRIAKMVGVEPSNFSNFINGKIGLSAPTTIKLLQLLNLSTREVEMKLGVKHVQIAHLQEQGAPMRLSNHGTGWYTERNSASPTSFAQANDGWLPAEGSQYYPVNSTSIIDTWEEGGQPSDDAIVDILRQVDNYHRQAREAIANWFANYRKAKPNAACPTEGSRRTDDNERSRTPGPHPDRFSRK